MYNATTQTYTEAYYTSPTTERSALLRLSSPEPEWSDHMDEEAGYLDVHVSSPVASGAGQQGSNGTLGEGRLFERMPWFTARMMHERTLLPDDVEWAMQDPPREGRLAFCHPSGALWGGEKGARHRLIQTKIDPTLDEDNQDG